jgi:Pyridoxamine 5'-phosphate oxidase
MTTLFQHTEFSEEDIRSFQPEMKIGLIATVNPRGLPHVTLISTVMASDAKKLVFGQFTEGLSKQNILRNPKAGFMIMSLAKDEWRGKALYTHMAKDGKDYDFYNNVPMFRYNSYFGVHTVYYLDLIGHSGKHALPMNSVILSAVGTLIGRSVAGKREKQPVLNAWSQAFLNKLDNLKFLSYVDTDGYPVIIPAIQAQCLDREHVVFDIGVYQGELLDIPKGVSLAVFAMALTMEDVLLRGVYQGIQRIGGIKQGLVKLDYIYNPMPPVPGQVYPSQPLRQVEQY